MTEHNEKKEDDTSVRVALRIRPQLARERIDMCQVCTTVIPEESQVLMGKDKAFTFDYVYDIEATQERIYDNCVKNLIDGCFEGYNATVFAYGQTGSGKTYTMGTGFDISIPDCEIGIIPRAVDHLFQGIEQRRAEAIARNEPAPDFKVNAQFMELYNEEIFDLLDTTRDPENRGRKSNAKIHEDASGGIYVVGVTTRLVHSMQDTMQCIQVGALSRSTASTNMNATSSRSHAIFTLHIKQHRLVKEEVVSDSPEEMGDGESADGKELVPSTDSLNEFETLTAKFHFVDLAGSERLKRTGATGDRAKEGISINCGLLALGNVISALGDKLKKGSHVPYRDSKLTRLLQDSLGGNSRTLMIACISPSDRDFMETLNTLKYANRARNIKNKIIANQDKASKQMAILRQEIQQLQQELLEFRSGRRVVDSEGIETSSDLFHESTMLQAENEKLRSRVKSLNETIERLTARNSELLADKDIVSLGNAANDASSDEVTKLIQGYMKELEILRAKLADTESQLEGFKRGRQMQMSMSRLSLSPCPSSMSQSLEVPLSPDNSIGSILDLAKKDVKRLKKTIKRSTSKINEESDKENAGQSDGERENGEEEEEEVEEKDRSEKSEKAEKENEDNVDENGNLDTEELGEEEEEEYEDELDMTSSSDSEGKDSDNIHEDLAELTCEISIKQKLIEELELSQKRLHSMKMQYEEKVMQLVTKIRETEAERDKVLSTIGKAETTSGDQSKKVKESYERKLNDMQNELKKLQAAKKEHAKLVKNQSHYEKQLKTLSHELAEMKKTKVRLMKQIKEDSEKNKQAEMRRNKEIAALRKEQMKKDGRIRSLENDKRSKDMVLRRKQEEVELLRKRSRPLSTKTAGRTGAYDKPLTVPKGPSFMSGPVVTRHRRRRGEFSARVAKHKWDSLEKNVSAVINKKQTITNIEKDMDVWLKHREKLVKKIEKNTKKKEAMVALGNPESEIKEVTDIIESLKSQMEFAQDNIEECQTNIVQVEEAKEEAESLDPATMISTVTLEEAKYLLDHFLHMTINKGLALAAKESEVRELNAKLHQTELNNTLQQDLLKHMMVDRIDIEVDNLMTNQMDDMESSTSSSSSSPVDSMFESRVDIPVPSKQQQQATVAATIASWEAAAKKDKARRRQATPEDLLFAGDEIPPPPLNPVPESLDDHPLQDVRRSLPNPIMSSSAPGAINGADNSLMPPPKSLPARQNSASRLPLVSPSMRRRDTSKPSPSPSPVLRRKNSFTLQLPRSNSLDTATSSDTTPPSSPQPSRRSERITDSNVFSRLTSSTAGISDFAAKRGSIVSASSKLNIKQTGPLTCTHTAEGHTKAVLSVTATENLLFTSSKDRTAKCWDLETAKEILSFSGHPNNVTVVKYSPADQMVFTVSQSYVSVWDIRDKPSKCIKTLSSSGLTQDGPVNSQTRQIDLPSGEHHINDVALNTSSTLLYSASGNVVRVWDLRRFAAVGKLSGGHQAAIMVIGVDQHEENDIVITGSKDHYIKVFEVMPEGAGVLTPKYNLEPPHYDGIQSLAVQGNSLFSGSRDTCIKKWDLTSQSLVQSVNAAHKDWICALAFMKGSSGNTLLSGCRAGYLKLWQMDTCAQLAEIKAHASPINAIASNSSAIFTASNDQTVRIWRTKQGSTESVDISDSADDKNLSSS